MPEGAAARHTAEAPEGQLAATPTAWLIANPTSGSALFAADVGRAVDALTAAGWQVEVRQTEAAGDAR